MSKKAPAPHDADAASSDAAPRGLFRGIMSSITGRVGVVIAALVVLVIAFGRFLAPYNPETINLSGPYDSPSGSHLLGTDGLGRDVLSRLLTGGDQVLLIPLVALLFSYLLGGLPGFLAAYRGGRLDVVVGRIFDILISMPVLLFALVGVAAVGPSFFVLVVVLLIADVPRCGRTVRAAASEEVAKDYVQAARARGESTPSILVREILPNIITPLASDFALRLTYGIIAIATLSFLGLGTQPPNPDWGLMINESRSALTFSPAAVLAPAVALALLSISLNLIAEAISQHVSGESKAGDNA